MTIIDLNAVSNDSTEVSNDVVECAVLIKKQWKGPTCEAFGAQFTDSGKIFQPFENTVSTLAFGS